MTTQHNPKVSPGPASNIEKDPDDWVSGDDPMTGAQASYLKTAATRTSTTLGQSRAGKAE